MILERQAHRNNPSVHPHYPDVRPLVSYALFFL